MRLKTIISKWSWYYSKRAVKSPNRRISAWPNPRKYFEETALAELSESIKLYGVLHPIIYYFNETGQKIIMAGKRRYQAAKNAGLKEIPAISFDVNEADKVVLTENILHQDLIPLKEAKNSNVWKRNTNEKLAQVFTKAANTISETLIINKLPDVIKE